MHGDDSIEDQWLCARVGDPKQIQTLDSEQVQLLLLKVPYPEPGPPSRVPWDKGDQQYGFL